MTVKTLDKKQPESSETVKKEVAPKQVTISIDELIIGRKAGSPVYDSKGVLLLAEGSVITPEIKTNLKARAEGGQIQVNEADLSKVTLRNIDAEPAPKFQIDETLTKKIDMILDNGLMTVKNEGPAVKNDVVFLGRKGYDQEQREKLVKQHEKNGEALGQMMSSAMRGDLTDGGAISGMAAGYLKEMMVDADNVLTSAIQDFGEDDIAARSLESALLAMAIGVEMDFDAENIKTLGVAGLTHDWGMVRVPAKIRNATHKLSRIDRLEIEKHPVYSMEMLQKVSTIPKIVPIIAYQVHEKYNGTGYPRGRRGGSIPIFSRILAVADTFISLTSVRPHRKAVMRYGAMECMLHLSRERSLDPDVMRALLRIQSLFPVGSYVTLTDGSVGKVIRANRDDYTKPIVQLIQLPDGSEADPLADESVIDMKESEIGVQQALPTPGRDEISFSPELMIEC